MPTCLEPHEVLRHVVRHCRDLVFMLVLEPGSISSAYVGVCPIDLFGMPIAPATVQRIQSNFDALGFWRVMKILATRIAKELKNAKHCAVYEPELTRVWPDGQNREAQITSFARNHGWRLRYYGHGFCAIFDKEPPNQRRTFVSGSS
jgi:hypothetical protein